MATPVKNSNATDDTPVLSEEAKAFIVEQYACFVPAPLIADRCEEQFHVRPNYRQMQWYNPEGPDARDATRGADVYKKWRPLFNATRTAFLSGIGTIGITHQTYRIRKMQEIIDDTSGKEDAALVLKTLEQAAKELGGIYTNERKVAVQRDGPTADEMRESISQRVADIMARRRTADGQTVN